MQLHSFLRILMPDDPKWNGNVDTNAQLFEQLPPQTFFQGFSRLTFPAGKLP